MSVRRRIMRKAEDTARRAVGPDPTDEPRLKFLSSNGEPTTQDRTEDEEADMTDGTGLYAIQELAQQDFDRLVQEASQGLKDSDADEGGDLPAGPDTVLGDYEKAMTELPGDEDFDLADEWQLGWDVADADGDSL